MANMKYYYRRLKRIAVLQTRQLVPNISMIAVFVAMGVVLGLLLNTALGPIKRPAQETATAQKPTKITPKTTTNSVNTLPKNLPEQVTANRPDEFVASKPTEPIRVEINGIPFPQKRPSGLKPLKNLETDLLAKVFPQPRPSNVGQALAGIFPRMRPDFSKPVKRVMAESMPQNNDRPMTVRMPPLKTARLGNCPSTLTASIPARPKNARDIRAVLASVENLEGTERDRKLEQEVLAGNIPGFLRKLVPVQISGKTRDGRNTDIVVCVTPDYVAAGSERDFVRLPFGLKSAMRIADRFEMELPTTRMVDLIFASAELHLAPSPMKPGNSMRTTNYFRMHNDKVERQRRQAGAKDGMLVAGQKKDVVLTEELFNNQGRVAIYGWHKSNGNPIQPLSTVHGAAYADYSHGLRLVSRTAYLNGQPTSLRDLMRNPVYAEFLNKEGPLREEVLASLDNLKAN